MQQDVLLTTKYPLSPLARDILVKRREVGIKEYGVPLHTYNNRDCLQDTIEELADALYYLLQAELEGDSVYSIIESTENLLIQVMKAKADRG